MKLTVDSLIDDVLSDQSFQDSVHEDTLHLIEILIMECTDWEFNGIFSDDFKCVFRDWIVEVKRTERWHPTSSGSLTHKRTSVNFRLTVTIDSDSKLRLDSADSPDLKGHLSLLWSKARESVIQNNIRNILGK